MFVAVVIHEGEAVSACVAATREEALAKVRAAHVASVLDWHDSPEAAAEAVQDDEDEGNVSFSVCPLSE